MSDEQRPVPLLGEISLEYVQRIETVVAPGFVPTSVVGLAGELQQRSQRGSHLVKISGLLVGEEARDQLASLHGAASAGGELTFSADISSALELQKVVITSFTAAEAAGVPGQIAYEIELAESPPLPPPAELSGFGGLDDFGVGDLGFDEGMLGDLADTAAQVAGAVDQAMGLVDAVSALGNLGDLNLGGVLEPLGSAVDKLGDIAESVQTAFAGLAEAFR